MIWSFTSGFGVFFGGTENHILSSLSAYATSQLLGVLEAHQRALGICLHSWGKAEILQITSFFFFFLYYSLKHFCGPRIFWQNYQEDVRNMSSATSIQGLSILDPEWWWMFPISFSYQRQSISREVLFICTTFSMIFREVLFSFNLPTWSTTPWARYCMVWGNICCLKT